MDKYYVYRPMLDLIGFTEGTDKGRGYNETLAYGAFTGGDVNLVGMTLAEVDALQTRMLRHKKNKWKSSAAGRYQIVRTTLRQIKTVLAILDSAKFDRDMTGWHATCSVCAASTNISPDGSARTL